MQYEIERENTNHGLFGPVTMNPDEIEDVVVFERLHRYNRGAPCGPRAIRTAMNELRITPLPSESTIGRILARRCLTRGRTGWYEGEERHSENRER